MKKDILLIVATIIAMFSVAGVIIYSYSSSSESVKEVGSQAEMSDAIETARFHLSEMESLLEIESLTSSQVDTFKDHTEKGLAAGQTAVEEEPENPESWSTLGNLYSAIVVTGTSNSYEHALKNLQQAHQLEPYNSVRTLDLAKLEIRNNDFTKAEEYLQETIRLDERNIEALSLLVQFAVEMDELDKAVSFTEALIKSESSNPAHYYRLGLLELSRGDTDAAIKALEVAIQLDSNYANARYMLGLTYFKLGRLTEAKQQIEAVLKMNTENSEVEALLREIEVAQNSQ